jgi:hypothetical protein
LERRYHNMAINQLGGGSAALEAKFNAKGDILVATANDISAAVSVGANGTILVADSSQAAGVAWAVNAPDVATTKGDLITRTASGYARIGVGTNGQGLLADSSTATGLVWGAPASVAYYNKVQAFTSSGTWTAPASVSRIDVLCLGAGGGGGAGARIGAGSSATPGSGGAGGNAVYIKNVPVTPGVTYTVTVGAGGLGGTGLNVFQSSANTTQTTGPTGAPGGDSSFGTVNTINYVMAKGGNGGRTANVSGSTSQSGNRFGQYSFGSGDSRWGAYWIGISTSNISSFRIDNETSTRTRWLSQNTTEESSDGFVYFGPDGSNYWPGGGSTSDTSEATVASQMSGYPLGYGQQSTRAWPKDVNNWFRNTILPLASGVVTPGVGSAGTNGSQAAGPGSPLGFGGGGGRGGLAVSASNAASTQGDFGNVGAGGGGGSGYNANAGSGGNAGANTGSGGGGGGGSFGQGTYISGTGGTGGSGLVVLGWVGA